LALTENKELRNELTAQIEQDGKTKKWMKLSMLEDSLAGIDFLKNRDDDS
jgi:hypothetical protein